MDELANMLTNDKTTKWSSITNSEREYIDECIASYFADEDESIVEDLTEEQQKQFQKILREALEKATIAFKKKRKINSIDDDLTSFIYNPTETEPQIYNTLKKAGLDDKELAKEILMDYRGVIVGIKSR